MDKLVVKFNDVTDVNKFVHVVSQYEGDFDLYCGSYCVDAKSLLGIMTIDLRNSMVLKSNCDRSDGERLKHELDWVAVA